MVWDVRDGVPFPDNSVEGIQSTHFLEHLDEDEAISFIQECLRVLKSGGQFLCLCPEYHSKGAIYLGHKSFWTLEKVDSLLRSEISLQPFVIVDNRVNINPKEFNELLFTLKKL
jgi:ubiquinone/menaquinone biosynthesis C-methylase UbiE